MAKRPLMGARPSSTRASPLGARSPAAVTSGRRPPATSSGVTSRCCPADASAAASASSAERPVLATMRDTVSAVIPVSTKPGQTAFTVTPLPATSAATERVRPIERVLGGGVGGEILPPPRPAVEAMFTTRPQCRSSIAGEHGPGAEEGAGGVDRHQPVPVVERGALERHRSGRARRC